MRYQIRTLVASVIFCLANSSVAQTDNAPSSDREPLVGTYRFVNFEIKDTNGNWRPDPNYKGNGYIIYSDDGYMGVQIMPAGRTPFPSNSNQPNSVQAQQALQGYYAYFGPFTVNENEKFVIHHRIGAINPGGDGDAKRFYDIEGNRLILTPPPESGIKEDAIRHVVWEKLPDVELSAEAKKFVGFRELLYTDRYTERNGDMVTHGQRNESDAGSYIIYTPTGHMMVHLMDKQGRTKYAGTTPTPIEALAAYRSYYGYFGRFTLFEHADPPYVVHNQEGKLNPSRPTDTERLYQISGDILRLGVRPRMNNGESNGGHLYWKFLPSLH